MIILIYSLIALYILKVLLYFIFLHNKTLHHNNSSTSPEENLSASIIIPMHNEEKVICNTIESLMELKNIDIILIDDGSTDNTIVKVSQYMKKNKLIKLYRQTNQGKSTALNLGIKMSKSKIIICIDADTIVTPTSIYLLIEKFKDSQIAAVSGNLRGTNLNNILTYTQDIEYISIYNFEREIFKAVDGITIIPGAIGAFRKNIIEKIGGYNYKSITEDIDLVKRLKDNQSIITNSNKSFGYTELPESIDMYIKQRIRWKTGLILNIKGYLQNKINNKKFNNLILPYLITYRIILPLFTPFIDYIFIYSLIFNITDYIVAYLLFNALDSTIIGYTLIKQEHPQYIVFTPLQRLIHRQLNGIVYICIFYFFITGNLIKWRRCKRYGTAK